MNVPPVLYQPLEHEFQPEALTYSLLTVTAVAKGVRQNNKIKNKSIELYRLMLKPRFCVSFYTLRKCIRS